MQAIFHTLGITDIWQLIAATMVFLLLPGPGTFCVLTCAAKGGLRGGFMAQAGLMLGDIVLMFMAAAGVAALLHANPVLFHGLQYLGAAYLAYLGGRLLFARGEAVVQSYPFPMPQISGAAFWSPCSTRKPSCSTWPSSRCSSTRSSTRARPPSWPWR